MSLESKIESWGERTIVWVQSTDIQSALNVLESGMADGLGISPYNGFVGDDISFLMNVPNLGGVVLPFASNYDLNHIKNVPNLRFLTVAGNVQPFDYGFCQDLEELRVEWHSKVALPDPSSKLQTLYIRGYKPTSKDLTDLPAYVGVKELEINQGNLVSLEGVDRLQVLVDASFFNLRQLHSVSALSQTKISSLHIDTCKKINDIESLSECEALRVFRLIACGKLNTLHVLDNFKKLDEFRFVNTDIEDGDMSPLFRLKSVGFLQKRNYSHTPEEVDQMIERSND